MALSASAASWVTSSKAQQTLAADVRQCALTCAAHAALYLIEAQLTLYQLREQPPVLQAVLCDKLTRLHAEFDARNRYWAGSQLDAEVSNALLQGQQQAASRYWN